MTEKNFEVEESLAGLVECAARFAENLSSLDQHPDGVFLAEQSREFAATVKQVHAVLDERIVATLGEQVPLQNNSYLQREELETAILKAKFMLSKINA
jgi:hypothetical protein